MGRAIARTWLPTSLFVLAMGAIAAKTLGGVWTPIVAASALIFTPIVWWLSLGGVDSVKPLRGAAVGALAGVTAHVMPLLLALLWFHVLRGARHQGEAGLGAIGDAIGVVIVLGGAAVATVVGAILGAAVTWLRKGY
jgi:hypothetical protein